MLFRLFAITAAFGVALGTPAVASGQAADPLETQTRAIIARFDTALRACGVTPPYVPGVVVDSMPSLVSFYTDDRSVHQSRWAEMPAEVQGMMGGWAAAGTLGLTPEGQFAEIFNSLLVPHELGHFVASFDGRLEREDSWTNEVLANRIAIAFWAQDTAGSAPIADRVENFNVFLGQLPSPVPEGADPHAYFESNYQALSNDAAAYGWYQGAFMRTAWAEHGTASFCDLVKPEGV
jgi:enamine deaminase RidA (YjgF/YER057c/UK114 family)